MTTGLTVALHEGREADAPTGWVEFIRAQGLPMVWDWSIVHAIARTHRSAVIAAVLRDGDTVRGLVTARLTGVRTRRGEVPLAGIADVDCLASGSLPGIVLDAGAGAEVWAEAVAAVRAEIRRAYGHRLHGVMFRQVGAQMLPAVLRSPAIVREGGPIAMFHNTFPDFEAYLASLSRSRRYSLRRSIQAVENDPELTVEFSPTDAGQPALKVAEVCELNDDVVRRNHQRWWLRKRLLAPELAQAELELTGLRWMCYRDRTAGPVAFATVWEHRVEPVGGAWGSKRGGRRDLWFHCNATLVRWCIESGYSSFVSGQGTIAEKIRLGFEPRRQWAVLVPHRR